MAAPPPAADETTLRLVIDSASPPYTMLLTTSISNSFLSSVLSLRAVLICVADCNMLVVSDGRIAV